MMKDVLEILKDIGFDDREIKIYFVLIKDNILSALQISKKSGIDRTTTYDVLEKLIHKGIVSVIKINNTKHFSVLMPKQLVSYFKEKYSCLESILPQLNKLSIEKQEVVRCEIFYGREGLRTIVKEIMARGKDHKAIGIRKEYEEIIGYLTGPAIKTLNNFKAKETAIVEKGSNFRKLKNGSYRYLEKSKMPPVTTVLYGDKSVFIIWTEPYFAVKIENKTFAKAQDEYFNMMWNMAKR